MLFRSSNTLKQQSSFNPQFGGRVERHEENSFVIRVSVNVELQTFKFATGRYTFQIPSVC